MATPQQIGRYRIIRELGRGGMAVVYLALDPAMNRQVAIKILPRQFTFDPAFQDRFRREAKIIASLEHPSIVPIYDFGVFEEQPYIVMRYMPGGSLSNRLLSGPLRLGEVNAMLFPIAAAVDKAHKQNIIHRDIKPDNILFDMEGQSYLSDFGIARLAEGTQTMTIIGTPAYMSPEQAQGDKAVDGRSDIYSLGVMLFEVLSGQSPYRADTPVKLMMKHVLEPIPNILAIKPDLPREFQAIINRAMAKDPADRYFSAVELAKDVNALVAGNNNDLNPMMLTVLDGPPEMPMPRSSPEKENRRAIHTGVWILIGVILLIFITAGSTLYFSGRNNTTAKLADNTDPQQAGGNENFNQTPEKPTSTSDAMNSLIATQTEIAKIIATQNIILTSQPEDQEPPAEEPTELPPTNTPSPIPPTATPSPSPTPIIIADLTSLTEVTVSEQTDSGVNTCGDTVTYGPDNLKDGQNDTAWRVNGDGIGATAWFNFDQEVTLKSINILPGYDKRDPCSPDVYWCTKYRIPSLIQISTSNGQTIELELINDCTWQVVDFQSITTSSLQLKIINSYPRREEHFADYTAISEVVIMGSR